MVDIVGIMLNSFSQALQLQSVCVLNRISKNPLCCLIAVEQARKIFQITSEEVHRLSVPRDGGTDLKYLVK